MVGAMILYDHVHPVGAFAKKAGIDVSCMGGFIGKIVAESLCCEDVQNDCTIKLSVHHFSLYVDEGFY